MSFRSVKRPKRATSRAFFGYEKVEKTFLCGILMF